MGELGPLDRRVRLESREEKQKIVENPKRSQAEKGEPKEKMTSQKGYLVVQAEISTSSKTKEP